MSSPALFAEARHDEAETYRQPLSVPARIGVLLAVIFCHVGGGWALTLISPTKLVVGEPKAMEVSMVAPDAPPDVALPPPPEDTPPPEPPQLESMIQPPMPDLPPPTFPVEAPPPKPKPPPPKPRPQPVPHPVVNAPPQPAAPPAPAAPRVLSPSQVCYLTRPQPVYPVRSRRNGEQGVVTATVLIDATGRPAQVTVQKSSGYSALDESAVSALKAARFCPYAEGGVPQSVLVTAPINFKLE